LDRPEETPRRESVFEIAPKIARLVIHIPNHRFSGTQHMLLKDMLESGTPAQGIRSSQYSFDTSSSDQEGQHIHSFHV
jgi:hypothetical protein